MTPHAAKFHLYEMVPGKMFSRSLKEVMEKPHCDFKSMKGSKPELQGKDFTDLEWAGILTQRRALEPLDGWAWEPITYVLCRTGDGQLRAFTRSDMGSVFGKSSADAQIYTKRLGAGGQRALPPPTRKQKAIQYDAESDDDYEFVTPHPDDAQKLLENEAQLEQRERDELLKDIGSKARMKKKGSSKVKVYPPPANEDELVAMTAAMNLYKRGLVNTKKYGMQI
ncbi:hypothetical protein B0A55_09243 [Friedmanniomyces simplex]|uniref:Uncharacterized protein n=1 Tax=Friedmanniomyces simplex TaxID=329884 RepID=A0A4U0XNL8_9PEZI|nr:hypothetical protein B0A55_09243 [Friedmanniomyces simplex]